MQKSSSYIRCFARFKTFCAILKTWKTPMEGCYMKQICNLKPTTSLKATLLYGCFSCFLNCTNAIKSHNASQIFDKVLNTALKRRKNAKLWLKSNMYANSLCIKRYGDNCVFSGFPKKQFRVVSVQAIYLFRFWWAGYTWGILYSESCLTLNLFKRIIKICQGETN